MRREYLLPAMLILAVSACDTRPAGRGDSSSGAQALREERNEQPACATLRDVVASDLVSLDGDVLYSVDETEGLAVTDVSEPGAPRIVARVPFVGAPLALYVRPPHAWIAYVDWDTPGAATVIRAIDITHPASPRILGSVTRRGVATGTALVGGAFYAMGAKNDGSTVVTAARIEGSGVRTIDEVTLEGRPAALAASPSGLATLTSIGETVSVSWIDLAYERPGAMTVRGTRRVAGGFPAWEREIVDADEGQAVRFLACRTAACSVDDDAAVRVVDFANGGDDVRASLPIRIGKGVPVVRFSGDRMFVADGGAMRVVDLHPVPRVIGSVPLSGTINSLRVHGDRVLAIGMVGTPSTGIEVAVHDVDIRVPSLPRLRGTATFGEDWTWTRAADDDRALSIDPSTELMALPFSTWRARDGRYATGAQVLALGRGAPTFRETLPADGHLERVMFVKGRLLAMGAGNVTVLDRARAHDLEVR